MNLQAALEHHNRVKAFQRQRRTRLVTLVLTDMVDASGLEGKDRTE